MSKNNIALKQLIAQHLPNKRLSMVRYVYILENNQGEFLMVYNFEPNFPSQVITNQWMCFSDCYFYLDLYEHDHFEMAQEVIEQRTNFEVGLDAFKVIALKTCELSVSYPESAINRHDIAAHRDFSHQAHFLYLYYYVQGLSPELFKYSSDEEDKVLWLPANKAYEKLDVSHDKAVLDQVINRSFTILQTYQ
jgi:hypothetical protein